MALCFLFLASVLLILALASSSSALPSTAPSSSLLSISGFSWAENLVFDGLGALFVSDAVQGCLYRISPSPSDSLSDSLSVSMNFTSSRLLCRGFKQFGGLAVSPDGLTLYAAAVMKNDDNQVEEKEEEEERKSSSFVVISLSTKPSPRPDGAAFEIVSQDLEHLCNGMMLVPGDNALYGTSEQGTLTRIDITTGKHSIVSNELLKPDGLWYDEKTNLLFIGELLTKKMRVFDVKSQSLLVEYFPAASSLGSVHMIDDLTVVGDVDINNLGATKIVAADWTGRQIIEFTMDGSWMKIVNPPEGITLFEPTSVRRGKGLGFDKNSYYVTEGGGITKTFTNRRVLQFSPGAI